MNSITLDAGCSRIKWQPRALPSSRSGKERCHALGLPHGFRVEPFCLHSRPSCAGPADPYPCRANCGHVCQALRAHAQNPIDKNAEAFVRRDALEASVVINIESVGTVPRLFESCVDAARPAETLDCLSRLLQPLRRNEHHPDDYQEYPWHAPSAQSIVSLLVQANLLSAHCTRT